MPLQSSPPLFRQASSMRTLVKDCRLACGPKRLNMREVRSVASMCSLFAAVEGHEGPMLSFLFRGLTAEGRGGAALFDALTGEARRASWYVEGEVPDMLDGRFAVLATLTALL